MSVEYDKYYQTENLFGEPYPELIKFYSSIEKKGELLDLGCGQGRDAIALARLGYTVTGIDNSLIGIQQLKEIARKEELPLKGFVEDIFTYADFGDFDHILLDSMFHFNKKDQDKEIDLLNKIFDQSKPGTYITICIQKSGKKLEILNSVISKNTSLNIFYQKELLYLYEDKASDHRSETKYEMICLNKK